MHDDDDDDDDDYDDYDGGDDDDVHDHDVHDDDDVDEMNRNEGVFFVIHLTRWKTRRIPQNIGAARSKCTFPGSTSVLAVNLYRKPHEPDGWTYHKPQISVSSSGVSERVFGNRGSIPAGFASDCRWQRPQDAWHTDATWKIPTLGTSVWRTLPNSPEA